jgi:hypothetical protein
MDFTKQKRSLDGDFDAILQNLEGINLKSEQNQSQ